MRCGRSPPPPVQIITAWRNEYGRRVPRWPASLCDSRSEGAAMPVDACPRPQVGEEWFPGIGPCTAPGIVEIGSRPARRHIGRCSAMRSNRRCSRQSRRMRVCSRAFAGDAGWMPPASHDHSCRPVMPSWHVVRSLPRPNHRTGSKSQRPGKPVGSVIRVTVPWSASELTLMPPSYFFTRWPARVRPSPIAPSREV